MKKFTDRRRQTTTDDDGRRRTPSDGNTSHGLRPGELKIKRIWNEWLCDKNAHIGKKDLIYHVEGFYSCLHFDISTKVENKYHPLSDMY